MKKEIIIPSNERFGFISGGNLVTSVPGFMIPIMRKTDIDENEYTYIGCRENELEKTLIFKKK